MRHGPRVWRVAGRLAAGALISLLALAAIVAIPPAERRVTFPGGKRFAFSIVDDTDLTTLARVKPLYDLMHSSGLRTTKTVWVMGRSTEAVDTNRGETLQDVEYLAFVEDLKRKGFEIALHGVRGGSSLRTETIQGLDEFRAKLSTSPRLHINHALNRDNLYWGAHRWTFPLWRWGFGLLQPYEFSGHVPESPYFWGDVAQRQVRYVRRFTFSEINVLRSNPSIPYRIASMPYVNYWFDAADGGSIDAFERLLQPANLDRLEREGGVCLVYAHLGAGSFNKDGEVHPRFAARIRDVASRAGWFAPVSEILDFLAEQPGWTPDLSLRQRLRLEAAFLVDRVR